jgi:hypothetical protein
MGKEIWSYQKTKLSIKSTDRQFSLPKKIKDQIKKDILEMLNQWPIDTLETEFLAKNKQNPRDDFFVYKKDMNHEDINDVFTMEDNETNYLMGKVSMKEHNLYYLVNIGQLVDILWEKKIMTINKNIQVRIANNLKRK